MVIIPFSLIALKDRRYLGAFRPLAVSGHVSLFPLLFTAQEFPIKVVYTITWLIAFLLTFDKLAPAYVFAARSVFPLVHHTDHVQGRETSCLAARSILPLVHRHRHTTDCVLLAGSPARPRRQVRVLAAHVHQLVLCHWSRGQLDKLLGCILHLIARSLMYSSNKSSVLDNLQLHEILSSASKPRSCLTFTTYCCDLVALHMANTHQVRHCNTTSITHYLTGSVSLGTARQIISSMWSLKHMYPAREDRQP